VVLENRVIEYVDHLHEHFLNRVTMRIGHYLPPTKPGYSIQMKAQSLADHEFPREARLGARDLL
jgi:L-fuconate dehydratase